jgi:DNA polymerase III subunit epsilon
MIGGRQAALGLVTSEIGGLAVQADDGPIIVMQRERLLAPRLTEAEIAAHAALVSKIGAKAIWVKYGR